MSENIKNKYPLVAMRLREALNDNNMSAQDLSNKSGVGKASISHYVNGTHCPNNITAIKIADALNVSPSWIMGIESAKKVDDEVVIDVARRAYNYQRLVKYFDRMSDANKETLINVAKGLANCDD